MMSSAEEEWTMHHYYFDEIESIEIDKHLFTLNYLKELLVQHMSAYADVPIRFMKRRDRKDMIKIAYGIELKEHVIYVYY